MATLTTAQRDALPASDFALPKTRDYPIPDVGHARDALARAAGKPEEAQVRAAVERRYPQLRKAEFEVEIWKADNTPEQIVYGIVLQPDIPDSQGDIVSASEIRKAAHRWLAEYRKQDVQHDEQTAAVVPVESFIAPADMNLAGQPVLAGSWVLASHVRDPDIWQRVEKRELTGYSIGGTGIRETIAA